MAGAFGWCCIVFTILCLCSLRVPRDSGAEDAHAMHLSLGRWSVNGGGGGGQLLPRLAGGDRTEQGRSDVTTDA